MVGFARSSRFALLALLGLALGLTAMAAAPPFPVDWQGVKAPMPQGAGWHGQEVLNGKIYVFGGLVGTETESSYTLNNTQVYDPATDTWTTKKPMPTARYLCTAVAVNGKIYVMGGRTIDSSGLGGPVDVNEVYDPATDTWTTKKATPSPIRGHMAAAFNNKIYVFGGNTGTYQKTMNIYDPATDTWSAGAAMSASRGYGAAVAVPDKGRIYVIGGDNGTSTSSKYLGNALAYDPATNTYDATPIKMVTGEYTSNFGACLSGTKIYVCSGSKWDFDAKTDTGQSAYTQVLDTAAGTFALLDALSPSPLTRNEARPSTVDGKVYLIGGAVGYRTVDVFDPGTGAWFEENAFAPAILQNANAAALNGKIYVINGVWAEFNDQVFTYDPATNVWSTLNATNPAPRYGAVSGVYNGKLVVADGADTLGVKGDAQMFDPAAGTFTSLPADPTPSNVAFGGVAGNSFYIFGGYNGTDDIATGRALDLTTNTWSTKASLPVPMENACAASVGGKIYIFGGYDGSSEGLNKNVLIYDPASDSFTTGAAMPTPVYQAAAAVYNNKILIYGGNNLYLQDISRYYRPAPFLQVYDPATNSFTSTSLVYARVDHCAAVVDDSLYAFLGSDNDYAEDRLDIANLAGGPPSLKASASGNPTSGAVPLTVAFTGGATNGTPPYTYSWNFGDGSAASTEQNPSHVYTTTGPFSAVLTVKDSVNATASASVTITPGSAALVATAAVDKTSGSKPLAVNFTGSATGGTEPYTYLWVFGDGTTNSTDQNPSHTYETAGEYRVTFTVRDADGTTGIDTHLTITVNDAPPPVVTAMAKIPTAPSFTLKVTGSNLQSGIQVYINGVLYTNVQWKSATFIKIKGGKALKALVPKGSTTNFRFVNPDGGETTFAFTY